MQEGVLAMSRRFKVIALSIMLIANMTIAPFMQLTSPAGIDRGPVAVANSPTDSSLDTAASSMGLFGLDTIWNGIKGFFEGIASFTQGMLEIGVCVSEWTTGGGSILIALLVCPGLGMVKGITNVLVLVFEDMFTVGIFTDAGTKDIMQSVHGAFTSIANVVFIIIFILVIYSMLTSVGLSNYHIKKMAPKLAIVAIAVNMSFFITGLLVDLSNVTGHGLKTFLNSVGQSAIIDKGCNDVHEGDATAIQDCIDAGGAEIGELFVLMAEGVTKADAFSSLTQATSAPSMLLVMAIAIVVVVIMMLIAAITVPILAAIRMVMLIFLVVVSPIAFVLILHEKTQPLFTKWFKAFGGLLIVFPAFAMFVGLSQIATIIFYSMDGTGDVGTLFLKSIGALISIASPVLFIKPLMKSSSKLMAAASQKVNGVLKGAAAVGITAATMGAGAAVAGAGFGAKAMGALKAAPGIGGKLGHGIESFGKNSLRRGKNNWASRLAAKDAAHKREGDHNERFHTAAQSGDEAWKQQAEMRRHEEDVSDAGAIYSGASNEEIQNAMAGFSTIKKPDGSLARGGAITDAGKQAAWQEGAKRKIINPETAFSQLISESLLDGMSAPSRAAALQQNAALTQALQAEHGENLVGGNLARQMSLGQVTSQDELEAGFLKRFGAMTDQTVAGDDKALKTLTDMAKSSSKQAAEATQKLDTASMSIIGNKEAEPHLSQESREILTKHLENRTRPPRP